ncbi:hypothetical protein ACB376_29915 [Klebsiella electrica]
MNIETVNELIQSLESAGELSIKERKYLDLAKAFKQLAADNVALKKFCKNAAFDADYEAELGMERGGFTDALNDIETPVTDRIVAGIKADGVEMAAKSDQFSSWVQQGLRSFAIGIRQGDDFDAKQLREGTDK